MINNCTIVKMMPKDNKYGNVVTKGFVLFRHWHSEMEFIYVNSGFLEIEIDGELYRVLEGQIMIVSSGALHAYMSAGPDSEIWVARIFLSDMLGYIGTKDQFADIYCNTLIIRATQQMKRIIRELIYADYGMLNECYTVIKASELTVELLNRKSSIRQYICTKVVQESETIAKMQQFIENSLHKDVTLSMVADYLGFSVSYCSKYIKKKTNLNFLDYVNSIRLREAESLLRTSDMNITDISYSTGFNSIQSFNRIFKKYRGVTPTEYKKSLINKNWSKTDNN